MKKFLATFIEILQQIPSVWYDHFWGKWKSSSFMLSFVPYLWSKINKKVTIRKKVTKQRIQVSEIFFRKPFCTSQKCHQQIRLICVFKECPPKTLSKLGGDYIFTNINWLVSRTDTNVTLLNTLGLGASFELYSVVIRHLEHCKKVKQIA